MDDVETVFPLPLWFVVLVMIICWPGLTACTTAPVEETWARLCFAQPLGRTESGLYVMRMYCTQEDSSEPDGR